VDVALLDTEWWKEYAGAREITRQFPEALLHLGLARRSGNDIVPMRAAVLLFARDPAALLGAKTAIRVTRYKGAAADRKPTPNIARPPKTITGPLIRQVPDALSYICDSLADGVRMGTLGFEVVQRYPVRVIREALTNAVVHRDYHVQRDIQVRLFDDRIEIESPGALPGPVTALNIMRTQFARNPVLVNHLREFPTPPNLDIGEGVQMMFSTMDVAGLYSPLYLTRPAIDRDAVVVVLFNAARPTVWDQVCAHIERAGSVTNTDLRAILRTDNTLRASKMLREWVRKGLLVPVEPGSAKRLRRYTRPERGGQPPFSMGGGKQTAPDA
jgi:ATP-dependent DNA helicase RecG